jgi:hypothetical protein
VRIVGPATPPRTNGCKPHIEDAAIGRCVADLALADELRSVLEKIRNEDGPIHGIFCLTEGECEDLARQDGNRLGTSLGPSLGRRGAGAIRG